jgi:phosphatidylserine decarboxylase
MSIDIIAIEKNCKRRKNVTLKFFNRITRKVEVEKVYGGAMVNWLYSTKLGEFFSKIITKAFFSKFYGCVQSWSISRFKIDKFIQDYNINMDEYLTEEDNHSTIPYSNFNQFFIRRFKNGKRPFDSNETILGAFAEARYFGHKEITEDLKIPVKGKYLKASELINNEKWNHFFSEGPLLLARLCPVDYHRFHFPVSGKVLDSFPIHGRFHSVNPMAIQKKNDILITNERHVTILETNEFKKLAYIEVGALCVGKIVQSKIYNSDMKFKKGEEKGYFLFGGSTVILIGEKGTWEPSSDILNNTKDGIETYVQLGTPVGNVLN